MEREVIAERLRQARRSLATARAEVESDGLIGTVDPAAADEVRDIGETAFEEVEREIDISVADMVDVELAEIEAAEARLADGRYGVCEMCGVPIPEERLVVVPWARRCVAHQRGLEQARTDFRPDVRSNVRPPS